MLKYHTEVETNLIVVIRKKKSKKNIFNGVFK